MVSKDRLGIGLSSGAFDSVRQLEKLAESISIPRHQPDLLANLSSSRKLLADSSLVVSQSRLAESFQQMQRSSEQARSALARISSFHDSAAAIQLQSISKIEFPALNALRDLSVTNRLSASLSIHSRVNEQLSALSKATEISNLFATQTRAISELQQIRSQQTFKVLASLKNSPFAQINTIDIPRFDISQFDVSNEELEIDPAIEEEIRSVVDFDALSETTKTVLLYVYDKIMLPLLLSILAAYIVIHVEEAKKQLEYVNTPSEVKSFVRSPNKHFDRSALSGYRVTTAEMLNFRAEPSMKSEIIMALPIGTLVEILDKSNRVWLYVEAEIDGEFEQGWISRRHTVYFK